MHWKGLWSIMLLRIRTNVGTWKLQTQATSKLSDIVTRIESAKEEVVGSKLWSVSRLPSKDPTGNEPLDLHRTLEVLGLGHGAMIYCQVKDPDQDGEGEDVVTGGNKLGSVQNSKQATTSSVIDLVDSDQEEYPAPKITDTAVSTSKRRIESSPESSIPSKISKGSASESDTGALNTPFTPPQVASYNVWFGPPDGDVHPQQRMKAIVDELAKCGDHTQLPFVGFQELTPELRQILEPHLRQRHYKFCTQPLQAYGVGMALSRDLNLLETNFRGYNNSSQGRGLLYSRTSTVIFGTTHLESFVNAKTYNGASQREEQAVQAATFLQEQLEEHPSLQLAIFTGDLNWDDERKQKSTAVNRPLLELLHTHRCGNWKDAGTPFDYTYDSKENPMLGGNLRRRFDRCLYLTQEGVSLSATLSKVGKSAIGGLTWKKKNPYTGATKVVPVAPSDHFGIAVKFEAGNNFLGKYGSRNLT
eukprot:Nitzschia sp. Nitz4//scaffold203_size38902//10019//11437//NITZ4_007658-RA/size38902-processed-gene-0.69-mRNA-1//-1//CDS//3329541418//5843//frame0